jgi:hypothetical protein
VRSINLFRRKYLYSALVLLSALVWWLTGQGPMVSLRLPDHDYRLIQAARLGPEEWISLSYIHSVELTKVEGRFKLGPGPRLMAWETRLASMGSGLPNTYTDRTRKDRGWLVVDEGMKPLGRVRFFLANINQTELKFGDRAVDLSGIKEGRILQIQAETVRTWRWLLWKLAGLTWPAGEGLR